MPVGFRYKQCVRIKFASARSLRHLEFSKTTKMIMRDHGATNMINILHTQVIVHATAKYFDCSKKFHLDTTISVQQFLAGKAFDKVKQTASVSLLLLLRPTRKSLYYIHQPASITLTSSIKLI